MNIDYGEILGRAWRITWKHKILWIFGILAGLGRGAGSSGNSGGSGNVQFSGNPPFQGGQFPLSPEAERFFSQIGRFFDMVDPTTVIAVVIGLICLAFLVSLVFMALQIIGTGGLIGGVQTADGTGQVTFGQAWRIGTKYFWRLFLLGLLIGVAGFVIVLVLLVPGILIAVGTMGIGVICLIPLICVLGVVGIVLGVLQHFAQFAIVLEDKGVIDSLKRSWEVVKAAVGPVIILGLILLLIGGVASFVLALPLILVVVPAVLGMVGLLVEGGQTLGTVALVAAGLVCVAWTPIMFVLDGIVQTWTMSAWTLAYKQFVAKMPGQPAPMPEPAAM
jgi:hypothetical protein